MTVVDALLEELVSKVVVVVGANVIVVVRTVVVVVVLGAVEVVELTGHFEGLVLSAWNRRETTA
jgi:hypothetical protein